MKKSILTVSAITLVLVQLYTQNIQSQSTYIPFHQSLQQGNTNFQNQAQRSGGINYEWITSRHDSWDTPSAGWVFSDSSQYSYNNQRLETGNTSIQYASQVWNNCSKTVYTYDAAGNILNILKQTWSNGNWQNTSNYMATFSSANNPITNTYQTWSSGDHTWLNT